MKSEILNNRGGAQAPYESPTAEVVAINAQGILCLSGGNEGYGNNTPDWFD